jgi:hypothetical protein
VVSRPSADYLEVSQRQKFGEAANFGEHILTAAGQQEIGYEIGQRIGCIIVRMCRRSFFESDRELELHPICMKIGGGRGIGRGIGGIGESDGESEGESD